MRQKRSLSFSPYALGLLSALLLSCQAPLSNAPPNLESRGADFSFAFSPDGEKLSVIATGYGTLPGVNETLRKKSSQLYLVDLNTDQLTPYPHDLDASLFQAWSPDGKTLAYASADRTLSLLNPGAPEQIQRLKSDSPFTTGLTWATATELASFQHNENNDILRQRLASNAPQTEPVLMKSPERTVTTSTIEAQTLISATYALSANTFLIKERYFPDQEAWIKVSDDADQANVYKPLTKDTISNHASLSQDKATLYYDVLPLGASEDRLSSEVFRLDVNSGAQVPLGKGFMPSISPDGSTLALIQDNNLVFTSPDGSAPREVLTKASLGENSVHTYQWHPDSQTLWVFTAPDSTSEFEVDGKAVTDTRYANVSIVAPDKITAFKLYEVDAKSGAYKEHPLDWNAVKANLN